MANEKMTQKSLLDYFDTQANNKAYEQALAASANFVMAFIRSGQIKSMTEAGAYLRQGQLELQPKLKADYLELALGAANKGLLDDLPVPGVDANVPANA